jgi:hypothetical protein
MKDEERMKTIIEMTMRLRDTHTTIADWVLLSKDGTDDEKQMAGYVLAAWLAEAGPEQERVQ